MNKFEYKRVENPEMELLNELGSEGWELVSVYKIHPENNYTWFILKRQLQ